MLKKKKKKKIYHPVETRDLSASALVFNLCREEKMASEEGQVIGCHTVDQWTEHFNKAKECNKLVSSHLELAFCFLELGLSIFVSFEKPSNYFRELVLSETLKACPFARPASMVFSPPFFGVIS